MKWNAAEWFSICCRSKVLNLQGYSIEASGFIGCVLKVALSKKMNMNITMQKIVQTMVVAKQNIKQVLDGSNFSALK